MTGTRFEQADYHLLNIQEPSGITFISREAGFLVVADDASTIWQVHRPEPRQVSPMARPLRADDGAFRDIESASYDPDTGVLRVLSERTRRVHELGLALGPNGRIALGAPQRRGRRLKRVQRRKNSGYEGFTTLPAHLSPDGHKWNVAVNERKPRRVCFFDPDTLKFAGHAKLPAAAKPLFPDLSSVAVAADGALFLLSDEGSRFGQFSLNRSTQSSKPGWKLHFVGQTPIVSTSLPLGDADRLQPEGLTFDDRGDLWIVTEGNGLLLRFRRTG